MSFLDRVRARQLMAEAGVDALVLFQPENFTYAVGAPPGMETSWRRGGATAVVVPADPAEPIAAVMGDLQAATVRKAVPDLDLRLHRIWIDTVDVRGIPSAGRPAAEVVRDGYRGTAKSGYPQPRRPTTIDLAESIGLVRDILREKRLDRGRLGTDLEFLPVADFRRIRSLLPDAASWSDASEIVKRLRMVKTPAEVERLRIGSRLSEAGYRHAIARVRLGQSRQELSAHFRDGVAAAAAALPGSGYVSAWDFSSIGDDPWSPEGEVFPGAIIKIDANCNVGGYVSDSARSFSFGKAPTLATDIYAVIMEAWLAGFDIIRPGALLRDVYAATAAVMRDAGYPDYLRGHFGHGLGASVGAEEWPFIAADSEIAIEPGMVLAFETPFYAKGIGALTIEDQILVTESGVDVMTDMPREMLELS